MLILKFMYADKNLYHRGISSWSLVSVIVSGRNTLQDGEKIAV